MDNVRVIPSTVLIGNPPVCSTRPLRVFCDLRGINKTLYCHETRELHAPATVTGADCYGFISSFVCAVTHAAEELEIIEYGEGGPSCEYVEKIARAVNDAICVPPLSASGLHSVCKKAYEHAAMERKYELEAALPCTLCSLDEKCEG